MAHSFVGVSGFSGVAGPTGVSGYSSKPMDEFLELKTTLQKTVEYQLSDLFSSYGFRIVRVVAEQQYDQDRVMFAVCVQSPMVKDGSVLGIDYGITRREIYDSMYMRYSNSLADNEVFRRAFDYIARKLRIEIEKATRDLPVISPNPYGSYSTARTTVYTIPSQLGISPSFTKTESEQITRILSDTKKKDKFVHIKSLIASSKSRLISEYANPSFNFKYF